MTPWPANGDGRLHEDQADHGERVALAQRLIVSPWWGRLCRGTIREGDAVESGMVVGRLRQATREFAIVAPVRGVFHGWLAREGEWVPQGRPLLTLRSADDEVD